MNGAAAMIATGVGAGFFALAMAFPYRPPMVAVDYALDTLLTTHQGKARAAVERLLLFPASAKFDVLRSVQVDQAKYVCGNVDAKDRTDAYVGYRPFVYTVAIDFARIEDDGRIAQRHDAFRPCPVSDDDKSGDRKWATSPEALKLAKAIQKGVPTADPSALTSMASQAASAGAQPGGAMQQQIGQLGGQPGSAGGQQGGAFKATLDNEKDWRADHPPAAWPEFAPGNPLAKPAEKHTDAEALTLAKEVEDRWAQHLADARKQQPSLADIRNALRALLAIDPRSEAYPKAWAAFLRLRKIEREAKV